MRSDAHAPGLSAWLTLLGWGATGAVESGTTDIKAVFDAMDKNGDGILTKREFRAGLEELNLIRDIP